MVQYVAAVSFGNVDFAEIDKATQKGNHPLGFVRYCHHTLSYLNIDLTTDPRHDGMVLAAVQRRRVGVPYPRVPVR